MKSIFLLILLSIYFINCKLPFFNLIKTKKGISEEKKITYVYGHINPDTDAISSAIILCDYLQQKYPQKIFIPGRLGEINKETEYALNYFKFNVPKLITDPVEADEVILVDHNNPTQSIKFDKANIIGLIDHHAITGFFTNNPINIITKPIGCTATILYELYNNNNITISEGIGGLIISAIISDTLLLKSAVTTQEDIDTVENLSSYFDINYKTFGLELLKRGTDVSDLTEEKIINLDSKSYKVNGYDIQIAFLNMIEVDSFLKDRKEKLLVEINKFVKDNKKQLFTLVIVDIINLDSTVLAEGKYIDVLEKAFNVTVVDNQVFLKGITSRKKEVYPKIAEEFEILPEYEDEDGGKNNSNNIKFNFMLLFILLILI